MSLTTKLLSASGGVDKLYVDDVFSAYTYTGNGSTQTISNGIDLAGKGGLVWVKPRSTAENHQLFDTARGVLKDLNTNKVDSEYSNANTLTAFLSTGFSVGSLTNSINTSNTTYISWTFRKAPKFFDVVQYNGDNASIYSRLINHSLGITPGMVIIKNITSTSDWGTYCRIDDTYCTYSLKLNTPANNTLNITKSAYLSDSDFRPVEGMNVLGNSYIAYLFAHDPSADGIIQCGSFTTDGSGNATVNLGWEPQYLMTKAIYGTYASGEPWCTQDTIRGMSETGSKLLFPNNSNLEYDNITYQEWGVPTSQGFKYARDANHNYIYLAIRRPNKPPTLGTQVFEVSKSVANAGAGTFGTLQAPDLYISKRANDSYLWRWFDRLRGEGVNITSSSSDAENTLVTGVSFSVAYGVSLDANAAGYLHNASVGVDYLFKRAPGVFDVVCFTAATAPYSIPHSLQVAPELIIIKGRSTVSNWEVAKGTTRFLLNLTNVGVIYDWITPTATELSFTGNNIAFGASEVAYLFATKAGISKVGSYVGNNGTQTIDCGFTTGARFVLIKRTNAVGNWFVWDTARGIVDGNDPRLSLNTTLAEVTGNDSIDPIASGFILNRPNDGALVNESGGTYIYLAFA